jgi:mannan endo-1,4-beta-mannosidase
LGNPVDRNKAYFGIVSLRGEDEALQEAFEVKALTGADADAVVRFLSWEDPFPAKACARIAAYGALPVLTWELFWPSIHKDNRRVCSADETGLDRVLSGECDGYIDRFALAAGTFGKPVMLRFLHEPNAGWYTWSGSKNGGPDRGPAKVKSVWKYVVDRFRAAGADNVLWLWCLHEPSVDVSPEVWNAVGEYWPGDSYVDWMGIDGFNNYPEHPEVDDPMFLSFRKCFRANYDQLVRLSEKPIAVMTATVEYNYSEYPSTKPEWITDAFSGLRENFPNIRLLSWFHCRLSDRCDFRINSSRESSEAFRIGLRKIKDR